MTYENEIREDKDLAELEWFFSDPDHLFDGYTHLVQMVSIDPLWEFLLEQHNLAELNWDILMEIADEKE